MADRDGLGDLPLFDTEVRPVREFVAQEQRQEDDYQYITRMYSALARQILDLIEDICDQIEYGNDEKIKEEMAAKMTEKLGYGPTGYFQIGAEVAANAGPRIVGVAFDVKK